MKTGDLFITKKDSTYFLPDEVITVVRFSKGVITYKYDDTENLCNKRIEVFEGQVIEVSSLVRELL